MYSSTSKASAIMLRQTMRGHTDQVRGIVHLPGERQIITCSVDGSLRLWDLASGTQIGENWQDGDNAGVRSMALSPNGKIVVSGDDDGNVRLWDVEKRKIVAKWRGHRNIVCALCWSADGSRVGSGSWDGTARVWDVKRGKNILTIKTRHDWVWAVMYSPNSSKLATGGHEDDAVKIWDTNTGGLLTILRHSNMVCSLAWTSDGKKLISGSFGPIRIFDTATWQQIAVLEGHRGLVNTISLSLNNRLLASASWDKTARLWTLDTNLQVGPPLQHERDVSSAALSPDGNVLVTGCENKNAYTWDVHAEAVSEDLLPIGTNIVPPDDSGIQHTPRSSLSVKSFLEADATRYPGQFGGVDELSPAFFHGMETDVDPSLTGGTYPHSSANALLARISSLLHRLRPENGESTELPQPSGHSVFHLHALLARLSSFIHSSPPENDAPEELQQPSTPSRVDPHEEAEPHPTTSLSSRPDALITRLSSLFRSQPHTDKEIKLAQLPSHPHVVEVAAVRDKQALVVARGPQFEKAKRAYEQQSQSHAQAQVSSSHTQPVDTSTSATPPAQGTAAAQSPPIPWWAEIVLFLCCASPPYANGHQRG